LIERCETIGVGRRCPGGGFELGWTMAAIGVVGCGPQHCIDPWKLGHYTLEATDGIRTKRHDMLRRGTAHTAGDPPPQLMVLDVGRTHLVSDSWSARHGGFRAGRGIALASLHEWPNAAALLRARSGGAAR